MAKRKKVGPKKASTNPNVSAQNPQKDDVLYKLLDAKIEVPVGLLRKKHIFIATPCYGGQIGEPYFRSMMRLAILCNKYGIQYTVSTLANESLITRGRNTLVSFFMENKQATHLFFIDADIEFNPEDVLRMLAYDKPIIVGAYPKKALNWESILQAARTPGLNETPQTIEGHSSNYVTNFAFAEDENGNRLPSVQIKDNLIKLLDGGTGFMTIKKEVIQQMFDKYPETKYNNDLNIDHCITNRAVMTAARPQTECPVDKILAFEILSSTEWNSSMGPHFIPNYIVDISEHWDKKIAALQCYSSEMRQHPHSRSFETVEALATFRGATNGFKKAEAFFVERILKK